MGSNWSPEVKYNCSSDCEQSGCPGHTMKIEYHRGSDTLSVFIDNKREHTFDDESIEALFKCHNAPCT